LVTPILGEGFSPTAEPFRSRLVQLGTTARRFQSTMAAASGSLWPDRPSPRRGPQRHPDLPRQLVRPTRKHWVPCPECT